MRKSRPQTAFLVIQGVILAAACIGCITDRDDALEVTNDFLCDDLGTPRPETEPASALLEEEAAPSMAAQGSLTLSRCFALALRHAESLRIRGERLVSAQAFRRETVGDLLPEILFSWQYQRDSDAVRFGGDEISPRDSTVSWLTVRQTLFDGELVSALDASGLVTEIERLGLKDERDRVLYSAAALFFEVLAIEEDLAALEADERLAVERLRVAEARFESGESVSNEVAVARAARIEAGFALSQRRYDREMARSRLISLIGLDELPTELVDNYELTWTPGLIPDLVERAWSTRSDLEAARVQIDLTRAQRKAELARYLPKVDAELNRWLKRDGAFIEEIDWTLALNATWTLFDSGAREAANSRVLSAVRQRELELSALERQVRQSVEEAVLGYRSLGAAVEALVARSAAFHETEVRVRALCNQDEALDLDLLAAVRDKERAGRELERTRLARKMAALKIRLVVGEINVSQPVTTMMEELER